MFRAEAFVDERTPAVRGRERAGRRGGLRPFSFVCVAVLRYPRRHQPAGGRPHTTPSCGALRTLAYDEAPETRRNPRSDDSLDNCDDSCCPSDAADTTICGRSCLVTESARSWQGGVLLHSTLITQRRSRPIRHSAGEGAATCTVTGRRVKPTAVYPSG